MPFRLTRYLQPLTGKSAPILFAVVVSAGLGGSIWQLQRAGREISHVETRYVREHVLTVYMSQADFMRARLAMLAATPQDPDSWLIPYEIAASRVETLRAFIDNAPSTPQEHAAVDAYAAFIAAADRIIAEAPDPATAARRVSVIAEQAGAQFPALLDEALHRSQELRREMIARNAAVIERTRLVALTAFLSLAAFSFTLLLLLQALRRRAAGLERMSDELSRALEVRRRFLASVSHDFRTPLNAISGFAQIMLHKDIPVTEEKRRRFLEQILEASQRLERMTRDLLDLARMERGAFDLHEDTDICLLNLARTVRERFAPIAARAGVRLTLVETGPARPMRLDSAAIERALSNLIDNAIKFSANGDSVTLRVEPRSDSVRISVQDHGPGIAPHRLSDIWDRFGQPSQPGQDHDRRRGAGLGLAIARGLIEAHGGRLTVRSREGQGSRFTIHLPYRGRTRDMAKAEVSAEAST